MARIFTALTSPADSSSAFLREGGAAGKTFMDAQRQQEADERVEAKEVRAVDAHKMDMEAARVGLAAKEMAASEVQSQMDAQGMEAEAEAKSWREKESTIKGYQDRGLLGGDFGAAMGNLVSGRAAAEARGEDTRSYDIAIVAERERMRENLEEVASTDRLATQRHRAKVLSGGEDEMPSAEDEEAIDGMSSEELSQLIEMLDKRQKDDVQMGSTLTYFEKWVVGAMEDPSATPKLAGGQAALAEFGRQLEKYRRDMPLGIRTPEQLQEELEAMAWEVEQEIMESWKNAQIDKKNKLYQAAAEASDARTLALRNDMTTLRGELVDYRNKRAEGGGGVAPAPVTGTKAAPAPVTAGQAAPGYKAVPDEGDERRSELLEATKTPASDAVGAAAGGEADVEAARRTARGGTDPGRGFDAALGVHEYASWEDSRKDPERGSYQRIRVGGVLYETLPDDDPWNDPDKRRRGAGAGARPESGGEAEVLDELISRLDAVLAEDDVISSGLTPGAGGMLPGDAGGLLLGGGQVPGGGGMEDVSAFAPPGLHPGLGNRMRERPLPNMSGTPSSPERQAERHAWVAENPGWETDGERFWQPRPRAGPLVDLRSVGLASPPRPPQEMVGPRSVVDEDPAAVVSSGVEAPVAEEEVARSAGREATGVLTGGRELLEKVRSVVKEPRTYGFAKQDRKVVRRLGTLATMLERALEGKDAERVQELSQKIEEVVGGAVPAAPGATAPAEPTTAAPGAPTPAAPTPAAPASAGFPAPVAEKIGTMRYGPVAGMEKGSEVAKAWADGADEFVSGLKDGVASMPASKKKTEMQKLLRKATQSHGSMDNARYGNAPKMVGGRYSRAKAMTLVDIHAELTALHAQGDPDLAWLGGVLGGGEEPLGAVEESRG